MGESLRVALVAPEAPGPFGGMERYGLEVARGLLSRGHEVSILIRKGAGPHPDLEGARMLPVLEGRVEGDRDLFRDMDRSAHDVWHSLSAGYAWIAMFREPVVASVHGNDFLDPWIPFRGGVTRHLGDRMALKGGRMRARRLLKRHAGKVALFLANSRYTRSRFLEACPVPASRVRVAYCGVGERFLEGPLRKKGTGGTLRLVSVCRLDEARKNIDVVLEALLRLEGTLDFEYSVIGDGRMRGDLERKAAALGLGGRARFPGRVEDPVLLEHLRGADLFILASGSSRRSYEGFGLAYLEANAAGTPVLAARSGGVLEVVEEGVSGLFASAPTAAGIEEGIREFVARRGEFRPESCREHAARFTWARTLDAVEDAYRTALDGGRTVVGP